MRWGWCGRWEWWRAQPVPVVEGGCEHGNAAFVGGGFVVRLVCLCC